MAGESDNDSSVVELGANFDEVGPRNPLNEYLTDNRRVEIEQDKMGFYRQGKSIGTTQFKLLGARVFAYIKCAESFMEQNNFASSQQLESLPAHELVSEVKRLH